MMQQQNRFEQSKDYKDKDKKFAPSSAASLFDEKRGPLRVVQILLDERALVYLGKHIGRFHRTWDGWSKVIADVGSSTERDGIARVARIKGVSREECLQYDRKKLQAINIIIGCAKKFNDNFKDGQLIGATKDAIAQTNDDLSQLIIAINSAPKILLNEKERGEEREFGDHDASEQAGYEKRFFLDAYQQEIAAVANPEQLHDDFLTWEVLESIHAELGRLRKQVSSADLTSFLAMGSLDLVMTREQWECDEYLSLMECVSVWFLPQQIRHQGPVKDVCRRATQDLCYLMTRIAASHCLGAHKKEFSELQPFITFVGESFEESLVDIRHKYGEMYRRTTERETLQRLTTENAKGVQEQASDFARNMDKEQACQKTLKTIGIHIRHKHEKKQALGSFAAILTVVEEGTKISVPTPAVSARKADEKPPPHPLILSLDQLPALTLNLLDWDSLSLINDKATELLTALNKKSFYNIRLINGVKEPERRAFIALTTSFQECWIPTVEGRDEDKLKKANDALKRLIKRLQASPHLADFHNDDSFRAALQPFFTTHATEIRKSLGFARKEYEKIRQLKEQMAKEIIALRQKVGSHVPWQFYAEQALKAPEKQPYEQCLIKIRIIIKEMMLDAARTGMLTPDILGTFATVLEHVDKATGQQLVSDSAGPATQERALTLF